MLQSIYVKNLALMDEIEVDFQGGLNVLTGETGAGKSILLGSVDLALGGRYTGDMIRAGASYGLVELTFLIEEKRLEQALNERDVFSEDGIVVLSRRLMEGRSVSKINGETVSKGQLSEIADLLIHIHGQHEHQTLRHKKNHLMVLDRFGGDKIEAIKAEYKKAYQIYRSCKKDLEEMDTDEVSRKKEMAFIEFEIQEIEEAHLQVGEDEECESEYRRMIDGKKLTEYTSAAYQYTGGSNEANASDLLSRAILSLSQVEKYDEQGTGLYQQAVEIDNLLADFNRELIEYEQSLEFSEADFYEVERRLNQINHLKSKYGSTIEAVLLYLEERSETLESLSNYESHLANLQNKWITAEENLAKTAEQLFVQRKIVGKDFVEAVSAGLKDLNFLDVRFEAQFEVSNYGLEGKEEVEFYLSTNPGEPLKPLGNIASGGELSRVMLVIKTLLADKDETGTLIFDEIDTGISGITATKVAQKLHLIGQKCQVLCITHLAGIASMADVHYLIEKRSVQNKTKTDIVCLEKEQSIQELARILGGDKITENVLKTAREMKEQRKRMGVKL
ncbi:MAG: DNA repair protein RecN [Lachnospiraceae bacterium]|nr:DNA repair protein RecN [Lachnospiraceae bacterium]